MENDTGYSSEDNNRGMNQPQGGVAVMTEPAMGKAQEPAIPPRIFSQERVVEATPYGYQKSIVETVPPENYPTSPEPSLPEEAPDTTLGEGVVFKGELTFNNLLRIDGHFEGELVSEGKLIVGPSGVVKSNITMREAIIEGKVEGNVAVLDRLELREQAEVRGDIDARLLSVDEGVIIVGKVSVTG